MRVFYPNIFPKIPIAAFSLIGITLSIFLGFRNNVCYDRWWEARKNWGALIYEMRNLARASRLLPDDVRRRVLYRAVGFAYQLNTKLRKHDISQTMKKWLPQSEYEQLMQHPNAADFILQQIHNGFLQCLRQGQLTDICYQQLSSKLDAMSAIQTGCERIQNTPLPFAYSLLLHRTSYSYCLLLPIGLGATLGF